MSVSENLQEIITRQKAMLKDLENEAHLIAQSDLALENAALKKEIEKLQSCLLENQKKLRAIYIKIAN